MHSYNQASLLYSSILGIVLILLPAIGAVGQSNTVALHNTIDGPARRALIVGNGDYHLQRLANPTNDARDLAMALEETGFDVLLRTNRTLEEMESDLRDFRRSINPGEVTLFFFAGHGVQVDGRNYLLPVNNDNIRDSSELRRKAIDAHAYVETMVDAGAGLNIVMLDACRDNPLPASSRGGSRGLSAMDPPRGSETVIVFATQAGDIAEDGDGSNSTFTHALLEEIHTPDIDLLTLFSRVGSDVREQTNGMQVPTIYAEPLSEPFFFSTTEGLAAKARAQSDAAQAEVDTLEEEIAGYQEMIAAAKSADEQRALELERVRRESQLDRQRLVAQRLEEDAARRERAARAAEERRKDREAQAAAARAEQEELARIAAERREELERLAEQVQNDDPDKTIHAIEEIKRTLAEIESEYDAILTNTLTNTRESYEVQLTSLEMESPRIWETDAMFSDRIDERRILIIEQRDDEITRQQEQIRRAEAEQTAILRERLQEAIAELEARRWTLTASDVDLEFLSYDRNERVWRFELTSTDPAVPLGPQLIEVRFGEPQTPESTAIVVDRGNVRDVVEAIKDIDEAIQTDGLVGTIVWRIAQKDEETYETWVDSIGIDNLLHEVSYTTETEIKISEFGAEQRSNPLMFVPTTITTGRFDGRIRIEGEAGDHANTYSGYLPKRRLEISVRYRNGAYVVRRFRPSYHKTIVIEPPVVGLDIQKIEIVPVLGWFGVGLFPLSVEVTETSITDEVTVFEKDGVFGNTFSYSPTLDFRGGPMISMGRGARRPGRLGLFGRISPYAGLGYGQIDSNDISNTTQQFVTRVFGSTFLLGFSVGVGPQGGESVFYSAGSLRTVDFGIGVDINYFDYGRKTDNELFGVEVVESPFDTNPSAVLSFGVNAGIGVRYSWFIPGSGNINDSRHQIYFSLFPGGLIDSFR